MNEDMAFLTSEQLHALSETKCRVRAEFAIRGFILYGSAVRGEADEESDIDLLILTEKALSRPERRRITDIVFHVNLQHGTNFSALVIDADTWQMGTVSVLPFHAEVLREGIAV